MRVLHPHFLACFFGLLLLFQQLPQVYFHDCDHGVKEADVEEGARSLDQDCALCDMALPVLTTAPEQLVVPMADRTAVSVVPELPCVLEGSPQLATVRGPPSRG